MPTDIPTTQRALSDDEMEDRARKNLSELDNKAHNSEHFGTELLVWGESSPLIENMIDEIGSETNNPDEFTRAPIASERITSQSSRSIETESNPRVVLGNFLERNLNGLSELNKKLHAIHHYRLNHELSYQKIHDNDRYFEGYKEKQRVRKRQEYAKIKAAEGKLVRDYNWHEHEYPGYMSYAMHRVLMQRTRQRSYRGVDASTVRSYNDLSHMTPEEFKAHKASQSLERQRRRRAKLKSDMSQDAGSPPQPRL